MSQKLVHFSLNPKVTSPFQPLPDPCLTFSPVGFLAWTPCVINKADLVSSVEVGLGESPKNDQTEGKGTREVGQKLEKEVSLSISLPSLFLFPLPLGMYVPTYIYTNFS